MLHSKLALHLIFKNNLILNWVGGSKILFHHVKGEGGERGERRHLRDSDMCYKVTSQLIIQYTSR